MKTSPRSWVPEGRHVRSTVPAPDESSAGEELIETTSPPGYNSSEDRGAEGTIPVLSASSTCIGHNLEVRKLGIDKPTIASIEHVDFSEKA